MRWGLTDPRPETSRYCELVFNKQIERDLKAESFAINSITQFRKALTLKLRSKLKVDLIVLIR